MSPTRPRIPRSARATLLGLGAVLLACSTSSPGQDEGAGKAPAQEEQWIQLFDGHDLSGWVPKFTHSALGVDFGNTFRVEDGLLEVVYDSPDYGGDFGGRFGHLFYETPYSSYRLRVEYRFVGDQMKGGPGWAYRNNGAMLHCQAPETMGLDQEFPVSIEAQILGGNGKDERPTANVCTPGTNIELNGELWTQHCTNSRSLTYHGDQWVTMEVEVHGDRVIRHWMEGEVVLEYQHPQLDPNDPDAKRLMAAGAKLPLKSGYIALQAESAPIQFRKVELLPLDD